MIGNLAGAGDALDAIIGDGKHSVAARALEWFASRMEEHTANAEKASAACRAIVGGEAATTEPF